MTDEQIIPPEMLEDQPFAADGDGIFDLPEEFNNQTEEQPSETETVPETPKKFFLGDEEVTEEQVKEWKLGYLRTEDYTRKNQAVAEERRQLEELAKNPAQVVMDAINQAPPDVRRQMAAEFAQQQGLTVVGYQPSQTQGVAAPQGALPANWNEFTENEQAIWLSQEAKFNQVSAQLREASSVLGEVKGFIQGQKEESLLASSTMQAAQTIKEQTGADVSTAELRALVKETGISDPTQAWWAKNGPNVASGAYRKGAQVAQSKPMSPSDSDGKTFDPMDPKYSSEQVLEMLAQNYRPIR